MALRGCSRAHRERAARILRRTKQTKEMRTPAERRKRRWKRFELHQAWRVVQQEAWAEDTSRCANRGPPGARSTTCFECRPLARAARAQQPRAEEGLARTQTAPTSTLEAGPAMQARFEGCRGSPPSPLPDSPAKAAHLSIITPVSTERPRSKPVHAPCNAGCNHSGGVHHEICHVTAATAAARLRDRDHAI
eukprot:1979445-Pleurochrysis_carterae.AAC.4